MIKLLLFFLFVMLAGCEGNTEFTYCNFEPGDNVLVKGARSGKAYVHRSRVEPPLLEPPLFGGPKLCWYLISFEDKHWHPDMAWVSEDKLWWCMVGQCQ